MVKPYSTDIIILIDGLWLFHVRQGPLADIQEDRVFIYLDIILCLRAYVCLGSIAAILRQNFVIGQMMSAIGSKAVIR